MASLTSLLPTAELRTTSGINDCAYWRHPRQAEAQPLVYWSVLTVVMPPSTPVSLWLTSRIILFRSKYARRALIRAPCCRSLVEPGCSHVVHEVSAWMEFLNVPEPVFNACSAEFISGRHNVFQWTNVLQPTVTNCNQRAPLPCAKLRAHDRLTLLAQHSVRVSSTRPSCVRTYAQYNSRQQNTSIVRATHQRQRDVTGSIHEWCATLFCPWRFLMQHLVTRLDTRRLSEVGCQRTLYKSARSVCAMSRLVVRIVLAVRCSDHSPTNDLDVSCSVGNVLFNNPKINLTWTSCLCTRLS